MARRKPIKIHEPTLIDVADLKPHPRNYRDHPEDQIEHLMQSMREQGFYRNVVIAKENTILAGHGVTIAAEQLGLKQVSAIRLNLAPYSPKALKILAADNYIEHLAQDNDRALTELLREIADTDHLLGTGFDEQMVAALAMVTRAATEIADFDAAAEWAGMPEYDGSTSLYSLAITCDTEEQRIELINLLGLTVARKNSQRVWSARYPPRDRLDNKSLMFEA